MESLLLSTTTATPGKPLSSKSLLHQSQPSFCNGDSSIFTAKLRNKMDRIKLSKPSLVPASQWKFDQPRERGRDHGRFENPWEHRRDHGQFDNPREQRRDHGRFENPWEQRRDHDHDYAADNRNTAGIDNSIESAMDIPVVSWEDLQYPAGQLGAIPKRGEVTDDKKQMEYLTKILSSKVYDVVDESPLQFAPRLSDGLGVNIWLKREDSQPEEYSFLLRGAYNLMSQLDPKEEEKKAQKSEGYSFKLRGAYNLMSHLPKEALEKRVVNRNQAQGEFTFRVRGAYNMMANLPKEELEKGVICASTGNEAQGIAMAANKLGSEVVIVMPTTTPPIQVEIVQNLGGKVVLYGDSFDDAQAHATQLSQEQNLPILTPFDHEDVIIGQGTVGMEISRQMRAPLHAIFVPVGAGDLLAGVASFYKPLFPQVKIIGVEAKDANSMASALYNDKIVRLDDVGTFADGVAVKQVGDKTFRISRELVDGIVLVDKDVVSAAIKQMYEDTGSMLEPAGALSIAGAKAYCKYNNIKGVNVVAITSGSNINFDQLRSIVDNAAAGNETEATFATILPEKPGALRKFSDLVGPSNITEFKYRYNPEKEAVVLYSLEANEASELEEAKKRIDSSSFETYNLTKNEVVRDHLRYMMGGRSKVPEEVLYRFTLPERRNALGQFLDAFSPRWNISLVHYRGQGTASADVLVGLQIPQPEMAEFHESAKRLGFDYIAVDNDPASKLLTQL